MGWEGIKEDWEGFIEEFGADFTDRDGVRWRRRHGLLSPNLGEGIVKGKLGEGLCKPCRRSP